MIQVLAHFGVEGTRSPVNTGVWVGKNKISAVGCTASHWITMHGIALNVSCDLNNFSNIIPCGIDEPGHGVCSLDNPYLTQNEQISPSEESRSDLLSRKNCDIGRLAELMTSSFASEFEIDKVDNIENPEVALQQLLAQYPNINKLELNKATSPPRQPIII